MRLCVCACVRVCVCACVRVCVCACVCVFVFMRVWWWWHAFVVCEITCTGACIPVKWAELSVLCVCVCHVTDLARSRDSGPAMFLSSVAQSPPSTYSITIHRCFCNTDTYSVNTRTSHIHCQHRHCQHMHIYCQHMHIHCLHMYGLVDDTYRLQ